MKITSLTDDGNITGEIIHKTDQEYPSHPLQRTGEIKTATLDVAGKFEARNGRLGVTLPLVYVWIYAEMFGGVYEMRTIENAGCTPNANGGSKF